MRPGAIHTDTEDFSVQRFESLHVVHEADVLFGAGGAPVEGIEDEDYTLLAFVVAEFYFFLILIFQGEVGCGCADGWGHDSSGVYESVRVPS